MTKEELAAKLSGIAYPADRHITTELINQAAAAGLVIVYGASDDLMEFGGAIRDEPGYSWTYRTAIPHATFEILDDGEPYCRGIVLALADVAKEKA